MSIPCPSSTTANGVGGGNVNLLANNEIRQDLLEYVFSNGNASDGAHQQVGGIPPSHPSPLNLAAGFLHHP